MERKQRDQILAAEAQSAVGQIAHLLGNKATNDIIGQIDRAYKAAWENGKET